VRREPRGGDLACERGTVAPDDRRGPEMASSDDTSADLDTNDPSRVLSDLTKAFAAIWITNVATVNQVPFEAVRGG
jgi:hypothetical protein